MKKTRIDTTISGQTGHSLPTANSNNYNAGSTESSMLPPPVDLPAWRLAAKDAIKVLRVLIDCSAWNFFLAPTNTLSCTAKALGLRFLPCAALITVCARVFAQDPWQTIDDFQFVSGLSSYGKDIGFSATNLFAVGGGTTESGGAAVVNVSTNGGTNWATKTFVPVGATSASLNAFASDSSGRLYVAGHAKTSTTVWIVYHSDDAGATWEMDDVAPFQLAPGKGAGCNNLAVDNTGNVYACGWAVDAKGIQCWIVRKRDAGGVWTTLEAIGSKTYASLASAVVVHPTDGVFVAGYLGTSGAQLWTVRRLNGGIWQTVDSYPAKYGSSATDMVVDSAGSVYVLGWTGTANKGLNFSNWVIRKRVAGPSSTWDSLLGPIQSSNYGYPSRMTIDASGRLFLSGSTGTPTIPTHWLVMRGEWVGDAWHWQSSDDFLGGTGAYALASDISGNVLAVGYGPGSAPGDGDHWIIRKLAPAP
jgi:hypothetical protein